MTITTTFELNNAVYTANASRSHCFRDADRISKAEFEAAEAEKALEEATSKQVKDEPKDEPKDNPEQGEEKKEEPKKASVTEEREGYYVVTDNRGRMVWKNSDKKIVIGCQPTKRGYFTIYISKYLLKEPADVIAALKDTFTVKADVNPTYKKTNGKDTYSVKATVDGITHADLPKLAGLLIDKATAKREPEKA